MPLANLDISSVFFLLPVASPKDKDCASVHMCAGARVCFVDSYAS